MLFDIINTAIRVLTSLVSNSRHTAATVVIVLYSVMFLMAIIFGLLIPIIMYVKNQEENKSTEQLICELILGFFITTTYFYGDNITIILQTYGDELGCSDKCKRNNRIASVILLTLSLLLTSSLGKTLVSFGLRCKYKEEKCEVLLWKHTTKTFLDLYKMDNINTTIALAVQSAEFCSPTDKSIPSAVLAICLVTGMTSVIRRGYKAFNHPDIDKITKYLVTLICCCLCVTFLCYLLTDNEQPLDCFLGCDRFANITGTKGPHFGINCQLTNNLSIRLGLSGIATILVIIALIANFYIFWNTNKSEGTYGVQ